MVALLTAGLCIGAMSASGAQPRQATARDSTLQVVAKRGVFSLTGTPAVGNGFVAGGDLYDAGGTKKIGDGYSHCGVVGVNAQTATFTAECTTVFALADGQLELASLRNYSVKGFSDSPMAITGGTGKYRTARGDGTASLSNPANHTYKFTLNITQ